MIGLLTEDLPIGKTSDVDHSGLFYVNSLGKRPQVKSPV